MRRGQTLGGAREIDLKSGATAGFAISHDVAIILFDDAVDHGKAQAGAFSYFLGGEEGLKNMGEDVRIHAYARVTDGKHDERARLGAQVLADVGVIEISVGGFNGES